MALARLTDLVTLATMMKPIPNRIKEHRLQAGLSQEGLAAIVGTSGQQIARLEKGERGLDDKWLGLIARALKISKADLLCENDGSRPGIAPGQREFAKNVEEVRLLIAWRALGDAERSVFLTALERMAPPLGDIDNVRRSA